MSTIRSYTGQGLACFIVRLDRMTVLFEPSLLDARLPVRAWPSYVPDPIAGCFRAALSTIRQSIGRSIAFLTSGLIKD